MEMTAADLLFQRPPVSGGIIKRQIAIHVQGGEALAAVLGNNLGDGAAVMFKATDFLQSVLVLVITHREPLGEIPFRIGNQQGGTAQQELQLTDFRTTGGDRNATVELG